MTVEVIKEAPIHITQGDLERYRAEYHKFMMHYCGNMTLEEYIRRQRHWNGLDETEVRTRITAMRHISQVVKTVRA